MPILNSNLLLGKSLNAFSHISPSQYFFGGLSICLGALLTWRVWRFTITPWMHPDEPVEIPYWIPFLGHARAFLSNQDELLSYAREYFKNSRKPFALTLGREKLYILTGYDDIVAAYKNNTTLDYGPVIDTLMQSFGITTESTKKMFEPTEDFIQRTRAYNPHAKNFFKLKSDFYHAQLHPGPRFEQTQKQFLTLLSDAMKFDSIPASVIRESTEKTKSVSLYRLCQEVFVRIGTKVFFGQQFLDLDPRLVHDFIDFDDYNWMVFYDWPQRAVATNPLRKVLDVIEAYLDLPKTARQDAAWMIDHFEDAQGQLDTRKEDVAVVLLMLMWV